jgi:DNA-binding HxlR family transcriptional regulator
MREVKVSWKPRRVYLRPHTDKIVAHLLYTLGSKGDMSVSFLHRRLGYDISENELIKLLEELEKLGLVRQYKLKTTDPFVPSTVFVGITKKGLEVFER